MSCTTRKIAPIGASLIPVSGELELRRCPTSASAVLDYLAKCERAATLRNRRDLVLHYQQCWNFLWDLNCGSLPLPLLAQFPKIECTPAPDMPMKGWKRDLLSRPMRKVVRARDERRVSELGYGPHFVTVLKLECGHEIEELFAPQSERKQLRRRCRECANPARATYAELQRRGVKPV